MLTWNLALSVDPEAPAPIFLQIARAIAAAIREGRLKPGQALPSIRALAEQVGVHRNTSQAAYQELAAEGWIVSKAGGGTYVAERIPQESPLAKGAAAPGAAGFDLPAVPERPRPEAFSRAVLACATGTPDPRMLPMVALSRAYARAMQGKDASHLVHGDPQGQPAYRRALAAMLGATRGLSVTPESLLITGGGQAGLQLLAQALVQQGDRVAVEALGSAEVRDLFRRAGAELVPLPVDGEGLQVEALEAALAEGPLRAVFLTPARQYPTTVTLAPGRRARLLALAKAHRLALIEDDRGSEFHFEGAPPLPLGAEDRAGLVITFGSLSKSLFPSLPLAHLHGPVDLIRRLRDLQAGLHQGADPVLERALAALLEDGEYVRHLNKVRKASKDRRDFLAEALRGELEGVVTLEVPSGGLALWLRVAEGIDVEAWSRAALRQGVSFNPGRAFDFHDRPLQALRLGFAAHAEEELQAVPQRMRRALEGLR